MEVMTQQPVKRVDFYGTTNGESVLRGSAYSDGTRVWVKPETPQMLRKLQEPMRTVANGRQVLVRAEQDPLKWMSLLCQGYRGSYAYATTMYNDGEGEDGIDEDLWAQCQRVIPQAVPDKLPAELGVVDGCRVFLVDGAVVMLQPDEEEDSEHPHADFIAGANSEEAPWVRREYGDKTLLLDARVTLKDAPFNLFHEAVERRNMEWGASYDHAHNVANEAELKVRERAAHGAVEIADSLL